jgi:predicted PhzF superfamily epimerase YddE/YHI9
VRIPYSWVDAFTAEPFGGNPAAVCRPPAPLEEVTMAALAAEFGLSETAFVVPEGEGFALRWFTPSAEVDLCGHATLAAAHALRQEGLVPEDRPVPFATRSGVLPVRFAGPLLELDFPAEPVEPCPVPEALGDLGPVRSAARVRLGLLAELADAEAVRAVSPSWVAGLDLGVDALVLTAAGAAPGVDYVLRVFAPWRLGIDEDPVTGSAQCPLGPFWAERLGRPSLVAEQLSPRGGRLEVRPDGDRVRIAGRAVTVATGEVRLGEP